MARKKKGLLGTIQENWTSFIIGLVIIVIIGLLVGNFLSNKKNEMIDNGEQTTSMEASPSPSSYKVAAGDSLSKISEKYYQDQTYWPLLARLNNISNPNVIYVDSSLNIPAKAEADQMRSQMTQTTYKVEAGDTLFTIAQKMYGDGSKWPQLARANNLGKLPNGNPLVFADSTITIPR